jgi:hypothetical protein
VEASSPSIIGLQCHIRAIGPDRPRLKSGTRKREGMNLLCILAGHNWNRDCCRCSRCGITRNVQHDWDGCVCTKCHRVTPAIRILVAEAQERFVHSKEVQSKNSYSDCIRYQCERPYEGFLDGSTIWERKDGTVDWRGDPNYKTGLLRDMSSEKLFEYHTRLTAQLKTELGSEWVFRDEEGATKGKCILDRIARFYATAKGSTVELEVFAKFDIGSRDSGVVVRNAQQDSAQALTIVAPVAVIVFGPVGEKILSSFVKSFIKQMPSGHVYAEASTSGLVSSSLMANPSSTLDVSVIGFMTTKPHWLASSIAIEKHWGSAFEQALERKARKTGLYMNVDKISHMYIEGDDVLLSRVVLRSSTCRQTCELAAAMDAAGNAARGNR